MSEPSNVLDTSNIDRLSQANILIVGDALLDRFVDGTVTRISREAPVPVLKRGAMVTRPGGACNVAANVLSCGGLATLVGLVGADPAGDELATLCEAFPGMTTALVRDPGRPTTEKTRYMSGWQQLLCVETSAAEASPDGIRVGLVETARKHLSTAGAMVLSDYGRGALDRKALAALIESARQTGLPVIVDPREDDPRAYSGASLVTPNLGEMEKFCGFWPEGDDGAVAACVNVLEQSDIGAVLLTRGADGMTLVQRGGKAAPLHVRAQSRQVFDVTGAGDTVVAVLAAAVASGAPMEEAVRLANLAAGIVVGKQGTATVHPPELRAALGSFRHSNVLGWDEAAQVVTLWKSLGLKIGFTNGCFDLLHGGHLFSLENAARHGDRLVVGLNSDASTKRLKGAGRPVQNAATRGQILAALRFVDMVVIFDDDTPEELIGTLGPDVLLKGADYAKKAIPGAAFVKAGGGSVVLLPLLEGYSTTATVQRIEDGADI